MSRIERLLRELSPVGVLFRELGDVIVDLRTGLNPRANFKLNPVGATNLYVTVRELGGFDIRPSDKTDRVDDAGLEIIQRRSRLKEGDVLFSATGTIGRTALVGRGPRDWNIKEGVYAISPDPRILESRFLIYLLHSKAIRGRILAQADGSTVASIPMATLRKIKIPVPSLDAQREIVRILGQFTQLQVELEAELEARRRQYDHYRQLAMSFDESIPRVPLGDIAEVRSGWGFPNVHQGQEEGEFPFYKVSDMNLLGNETVMSIANHYVSAEVAKKLGVRPAPAGTVIFPKIGAAVATNKKRVLSVPSAYDNNVMGLVPTERVTSRFLYHWMQTIDLSRLANDSGAVPSIRKSEAEQVLIPLPDLDTQRRVADLLDKFDTLVNDLSVGLPAELAARRKQYEYYRDKLLTFEEAAA